MKLRHSARTDVGRTRDHNEDNFGVGEDAEAIDRLGQLLIVCDGMGGHAAGEVASQIGVETILQAYYDDDSEDRAAVLEQVFEQANTAIYEKGRGSMGTTGVAALLHHDALHIANVGDSRAYLIRDGAMRQISRDHSFVSDQVAAGLITPEQARSSPHRNVITRALGHQAGVTVDMFRLPLQIDDIVVLCSDGLHGLVNDPEIARIASDEPPQEAVAQLIELANLRGGHDNITVVIAHVDALDWDSQPVVDEDLMARHERVTVELPLSADEEAIAQAPAAVPASPAVSAPLPPAAATAVHAALPPRPAPAPAPTPAARPAPQPRRLTLLGALLAALLLTVLIFVILIALNQPPGTDATTTPAPTAQSPVASPPAPTAQPTAAQPTRTLQPTTAATFTPATRPTVAGASTRTTLPTAAGSPTRAAQPTSSLATPAARTTTAAPAAPALQPISSTSAVATARRSPTAQPPPNPGERTGRPLP